MTFSKSYHIFFVLYALSTAFSGITAVPYQDYTVRTCDEKVFLDCPTAGSGSAGRITFYPHITVNSTPNNFPYNNYGYTDHCDPSSSCKLTVLIDDHCASLMAQGDEYALYLNLRSIDIPAFSSLEIYDAVHHGDPVLRRSWDGQRGWQNKNPTSFAQFRSQSMERLNVFIEYRHGGLCRTTREVVFDFVIVEAKHTVNNTYCYALNGYVNNKYICDTTDDRVNCPTILSDTTKAMEPAYARQFCWPSYWVMGGIVVAAVAAVALLVAMVALCRRRCRKCSCSCRPRKICSWSSQRQCDVWSPYCTCAIKYDIQCDTGTDERLLAKKNRF
ncbi:uncharacterized protein LOC129595562 [Paramacrobiotus metropolitanus]|uniref:uncharacterized protein LOC129595562 n=1 Tax=Paramacrobiotus metropolitanus TaxID=2943436 RepID=UPI0024456823|nr:uncharacterized protein LOC129595562 [Paramacrobiotus metropolitanus]